MEPDVSMMKIVSRGRRTVDDAGGVIGEHCGFLHRCAARPRQRRAHALVADHADEPSEVVVEPVDALAGILPEVARHTSEMERSNITYTEMFKMVKKKLAREKGIIL